MTHVATMGAFSCATIAIGRFKNQYDINEKYKQDKKAFREGFKAAGFTVSSFYNEILYPIAQNLGRSAEYPFEFLMEEIEKSEMNGKFIIAVLNSDLFLMKDGYWPKELNRWGFELIDKTNNDIGGVNYIFTRNRNRLGITKDEK